jgi:hypothetical protein
MASASTAVGAVAKEIKFIAVARRGDKAVLCHRIHTSDKSYDYIANVQKASAAAAAGWRQRRRQRRRRRRRRRRRLWRSEQARARTSTREREREADSAAPARACLCRSGALALCPVNLGGVAGGPSSLSRATR